MIHTVSVVLAVADKPDQQVKDGAAAAGDTTRRPMENKFGELLEFENCGADVRFVR